MDNKLKLINLFIFEIGDQGYSNIGRMSLFIVETEEGTVTLDVHVQGKINFNLH